LPAGAVNVTVTAIEIRFVGRLDGASSLIGSCSQDGGEQLTGATWPLPSAVPVIGPPWNFTDAGAALRTPTVTEEGDTAARADTANAAIGASVANATATTRSRKPVMRVRFAA